jgi:Transposase DDE domain
MMQSKYDILQSSEQDNQHVSQELAQLLENYLTPLLQILDLLLDKRLVRTFVQCCVAILRFRNMKQGLLLSELGAYLQGYQGQSEAAPAGTKRISNLLRSLKWSVTSIDGYLLEEANKEVEKIKQQGKRILCIWDESVLEKPESQKLEGIAPVLSSKAKRLSRSRKGLLFNRPAGTPIRVMGMQWTAALITGLEGIPQIAVMNWWTTRGEYAVKLREQEEKALRICVRKWGAALTHVFDRGYASGPWIATLQTLRVRFVIRWVKKHKFFDAEGHEKKLWEISRGKRYRTHKDIFNTATQQKMPCNLWWGQVWHASYAGPLYVLKVRTTKEVGYLITNEPIKEEKQAWDIFFTYKRRWQIETSFRYGKSELAMESPRLWFMENRLKLLSIVTIVYAFLLSLLEPHCKDLLERILRLKCHRTGKRCQETHMPLYRLRWAISRLFNDHRPVLGHLFPPNWETLQVLASKRC